MAVDSAQMWSLLVGAIFPPALALVQQERWSSTIKAIVAFVGCIIVGLGVTYFAGQLVFDRTDTQHIITNCLIVLVSALTLYESFWKQTGIAPSIEHATSPTSPATNTPAPSVPSVPGSVVTVHIGDTPIATVPIAPPVTPATPPATPPASPAP